VFFYFFSGVPETFPFLQSRYSFPHGGTDSRVGFLSGVLSFLPPWIDFQYAPNRGFPPCALKMLEGNPNGADILIRRIFSRLSLPHYLDSGSAAKALFFLGRAFYRMA